jgi:hypothetical protein
MYSDNICDKASFNFDITGKENVQFLVAEGSTILVTYIKDGSLYNAASFDSGHKFTEPRRIMEMNGDLREIKGLAKGRQFVIATVERLPKKDVKRAVAGWIKPEEQSFSFKQCTTYEYEKIVNVSLGFRPYESGKKESSEGKNEYEANEESVDYVFYEDRDFRIKIDVQGHGSPLEIAKATFSKSNMASRYQT